jgi:hypothetical protein
MLIGLAHPRRLLPFGLGKGAGEGMAEELAEGGQAGHR